MARRQQRNVILTTLDIQNGTTFLDALAIVDGMFTSASVARVVMDFGGLEDGREIRSTVLAALAACKGVMVNVMSVITVAGELPEAFMMPNGPNMTKLALLGHAIMSIDPDVFSEGMAATVAVYRATIGEAENLWTFGATGTVPGKTARTTVLRQYAAKAAPTGTEKTALVQMLRASIDGVIRT
jgi:hypothetical protein